MEVVAENGDLLHNVLAHARYLGEEEEGEEAGDAAEATEEGTAGCVLDDGFVRGELLW